MQPYGFMTARRIVAGPGTVGQMSDILKAQGTEKALVVTDPGIVGAGLITGSLAALEAKHIKVDVLPEVGPEPTAPDVECLFHKIKGTQYDMLIGFGGGSSLDVAKLLAARYANHEPVDQLAGIDKVRHKGVPTMLVPTTAGTGSETTPNAIVTLTDQQLKVGIVSQHLLPDFVILDPELTLSLPKPITAATGMDAFIHSLESFISNKANPIADTFCLHSMRLISQSIERAYSNGSDLEARHDMLIGATLGGMALTSSGTAAVHALAYPLGGKYGISHGVSNSMLLVPVLEFNMDAIEPKLTQVGEAMGLRVSGMPADKAASTVVERVREMACYLNVPAHLDDFGITRADLDDLSISASKVTRLLNNNPKPMSVDDIRKVYERLFR